VPWGIVRGYVIESKGGLALRADALRALAPASSAQMDPGFTQHPCDIHFSLEFLSFRRASVASWEESAVLWSGNGA